MSKPVQKFRIGKLSASVFMNEKDGNRFYNVEIVRNYTDAEGTWQTTASFTHSDLLNVARLSERAEAYLSQLN